MHLENTVPHWLEAVPHLPPRAIVRAIGSPSWLVQVKQLRPDVYTSYRFFIGEGQTAEGDWEACKAHWRRIYARWVDRTYLEQYAPHIDLVAEANEYAATSTWSNPSDKAKVLQSCRASVWVWSNEYRGRVVRSADGGEGLIPADCRLSILAQPVSNWIPRDIFELALAEDCAIDYRAYIHCHAGERSPFDWAEHSGLWNVMEQAHGLYPLWMFGEGGVPYFDVHAGWRSPNVLGHDEDKLEAVCRSFYRDVRGTRAYRDNRILGVQGCQFSTGDPHGEWHAYELGTPQLIRLAKAAREELIPQEESDVDAADRKEIARLARLIIERTGEPLVPAPWWTTRTPPYQVQAPAGPLGLHAAPDGALLRTISDGRTMDVWERNGDWLRVTQAPATLYWVKAALVAAL